MKRIVLLAAIALAAPRLGAAQDAAPPLQENPKAARFNDVERGFFVGFQFGYLSFFDTPTDDRANNPYAGSSGGRSGGTVVGMELGYDFSPKLSFSVIAQGANERAKVSYGAFSIYAVGGDVRYAYYSTRDRNDWERFFLYVHARGMYGQTYPKGLFGTNEILIQAGPGVEYFTRLRHFSVGMALDYVYAAQAGASGFALYPTVRYTF